MRRIVVVDRYVWPRPVLGWCLGPNNQPWRNLDMSDDPEKVWPTGLTLKEAEEVHSYLIDGTRVFGLIALLAHILVATSTPWLG